MSDYALQRLNMVESQVRPSDLTDRRIIRAMLSLPREAFVPRDMRSVCYMDQDVPVQVSKEAGGSGEPRYLLAPRTQAKLIQALDLGDDAIVLDVGGATGYSAAILGRIAQTVVALENDAELLAIGQEAFDQEDIANVVTVTGPLADGHDPEGPYDAILLNGAVHHLPDGLLDQLKDGGVLAAIRVEDGLGRAVQVRRSGGQFAERAVFDAEAPVLPGFEKAATFVF